MATLYLLSKVSFPAYSTHHKYRIADDEILPSLFHIMFTKRNIF